MENIASQTILDLKASESKGLFSYLECIRENRFQYQQGLKLAVGFVVNHGGSSSDLENGETKLVLGDAWAYCFQPFDDIDLFYFEA